MYSATKTLQSVLNIAGVKLGNLVFHVDYQQEEKLEIFLAQNHLHISPLTVNFTYEVLSVFSKRNMVPFICE